MSESNITEPLTDWGRIDTDVLLCIFRKLDMISLLNCMLVNEHWQNNAKYLCNLDHKWDKVVDEVTNWKTSVFRDKSNLDDKGIVNSAWSWHYVKNATLSLNHRHEIEFLKTICIYKDNLIVTSRGGVEYYNIHTFQLLETVERKSVNQYFETSSFIVKYSSVRILNYSEFTLVNKLHFPKCDCIKPLESTMRGVVYWRIDNNSCYVWYKNYILYRYTADKCKWIEKTLAKYKYRPDFYYGMNVHRKKTFLFTWHEHAYKRNSFRCCSKLINKIAVALPNSIKPRMFNTFSVLCAGTTKKQLNIKVQSMGEQMVVACPGLSSATEHGHMLILGYKDGKIQVFRRAELSKRIMNPEVQFYLRDYSPSPSYKIIAIDVYEARNCHHLFVATECNIYVFYIKYNDTATTETTDRANSEITDTANNEITDIANSEITDTATNEITDTANNEITDTANSEITDT